MDKQNGLKDESVSVPNWDSRIIQIESGFKLISHCSDSVFVFATLWPSWFFAARASGFHRITVCVEDMSKTTKLALDAVMTGREEVMKTKEDWLKDVLSAADQRKGRRFLVLLQGPEQSLAAIQSYLSARLNIGPHQEWVLVAVVTPKHVRNGLLVEGESVGRKRKRVALLNGTNSRFLLNHRMVGGVIDHSWEVSTNKVLTGPVLNRLQRSTQVIACVSDYLSSTAPGMHIKEPARVNRRQVLQWKQRAVVVEARSVFAGSGWVRRQVTGKELMLMYDIGVQEGKIMHQAVCRENETLSSDFTQQVPVRVLLRALEMLGDLDQRTETLETQGTQTRVVGERLDVDNKELERRMIEQLDTISEVTRSATADEAKQAAKHDDAQVKVQEWNARACAAVGLVYQPAIHDAALDKLRCLLIRRYRSVHSGVIGSFRRYMKHEYGAEWLKSMHLMRKKRRGANNNIVRDYDVGMDAIHRAVAASFWEWDDGSTVFFWRWPIEVRHEVRDGLKVWFREKDLPHYWGRQRWPVDSSQREQLEDKITKIIKRRYIVSGYVKSLTSFFAVPKGLDDIRVVYDATKSGLNGAIWSPNFFLPTVSSVLQNATENTFFGDIDLGEMFLNFFLDSRLRPWAGVDVGALLVNEGEKRNGSVQQGRVLRWDRSLMGVRSSPFNCVRAYLLSEDVIKGDRQENQNPFRWDRVVLNMPGSESYEPSRPWVYKYDDTNNKLAAFVVSYVDDLRTGDDGGKLQCDLVTHHVATKLNYLGEQDAARKRGSASQEPGAWAGAVIEARVHEGLFVTISQEKWNKVQRILRYYGDKINDSETGKDILLEYKRLEQDTGFLVHVFMTYENLRPYLKGFYLTLNEWRFDRNNEGWKLGKRHWEELADDWFDDSQRWLEARDLVKTKEEGKAMPHMVKMTPQFLRDVEVLTMMFKTPTPSKRLIRGLEVARILYGFGDASGAGFGMSWEVVTIMKKDEQSRSNDVPKIRYRLGRWGKEADDTSSNYRELRNLVNSLELMGESGELSGVEVFLFTDNSTAESACARGSSSCKSLFDLVKRLKLLEMVYKTRVHVIHVAGKRMIAQGADGLSRGCLSEGVMRGEAMLAFVPLHQTVAERSKGMIQWLQEHCDVEGHSPFHLLALEEWYVLGHDIVGGTCNSDGVWVPTYRAGNFIWAPPPCVAQQCLEELRKARHKRQVSAHVFVCPRIMNSVWQKHLYKSADLVITISPGHPQWGEDQHEPLLVGFYFPYLQHEPWQLKGSAKILGVARHMQRVCKANPISTGHILRQLWSFARELPSMSEHMVLQLLQGVGPLTIPQTASRKRRRASMEEDKG